MSIFYGNIEIILMDEGSKSEGRRVIFSTDKKEFTLLREGMLEINDDFFEPFVGVDVIVEGDVVADKWLKAHNISINKTNEETEEKI